MATDRCRFRISSSGDHFQQALLLAIANYATKQKRAALFKRILASKTNVTSLAPWQQPAVPGAKTNGKQREISNDLSALRNNKGVGQLFKEGA